MYARFYSIQNIFSFEQKIHQKSSKMMEQYRDREIEKEKERHAVRYIIHTVQSRIILYSIAERILQCSNTHLI